MGIAVSVGITMFNAQATNSNRQAIVGDLNNFAAQSLAFYKTPTSHGGGGSAWGTIAELGMWLGYDFNGTDSLGTGNGSYKISSISTENLIIIGSGTQEGNDPAYANANGTLNGRVAATMTVTGNTDNIAMVLDN